MTSQSTERQTGWHNKPVLLTANWTVEASTQGRRSAATSLTPFVVAAVGVPCEGLALPQIGESLGRNPTQSLKVDVARLVLSPTDMARRDDSRWVLLVPSGLVGAFVMMTAQAPMHRWAVHIFALVLAIALHLLLARRPIGSNKFTPAFPLLCLLMMTMTLGASGLEGVRRWVSVGPLLIHLSSLLAPALLVACAMLARSRPGYSAVLLLGTQALHLLQPDAGQATAFGVAALFVSVAPKRRFFASVKLLLLAAVCSAWFLPDPLGPMPFVEDIIQRAFSIGVVPGALAVLALLLYAVSPLWSASPTADSAKLRRMVATYFALTALVSTFGEFPVPLVGYGPSPLIGAFLGLAFLARAERLLVAEASTTNQPSSDVSSDVFLPCTDVLPNKALVRDGRRLRFGFAERPRSERTHLAPRFGHGNRHRRRMYI